MNKMVMNNVLMRNTKLALTALAVIFLIGCGGATEVNIPTPTYTPPPTYTPEPIPKATETATAVAWQFTPESEKYYERGNDFLGSGDVETAIASYNKAIELAPNYAMAYNNVEVLTDNGQFAFADQVKFDALKKTLKISMNQENKKVKLKLIK